MAAYRYYKLNATEGASGSVFMINEIELYPWITAGSDLTTSGMTVTDNQNYGAGYEGSKAFNNTFSTGPGNRWQMNGTSYPIWVKIDLGSGNAQSVCSYMVMCDDASYYPKTWTLEGSNDDSSWTTISTVTGQTGWATGERRYFVCDFLYTLSGTVKDASNSGIARAVRAIRKSDGAFAGDTMSNASTGVWSIATPTDDEYQVIEFKSSASDEHANIYDGVVPI